MKDMTAQDCREQASECRLMTRKAMTDAHRVMLEHIAETWERIAKEVESA